MKNIIVVGSGGHAKVVIDMLEKQRQYSIVGLIDKKENVGKTVSGYTVLGDIEYLLDIKKDLYGGIVAIGENWTRSVVVSQITSVMPNFRFVTAIHPSAIIAEGVKIGCGTTVSAGVIINKDSIIGNHCIINTKSSVDHDNLIGNFVSLFPNVTIGGNVSIGDFSSICLGSNVINSTTIGKHTVIGAGSTVLENIRDNVIAFGTPAKIIRERKETDKVLR